MAWERTCLFFSTVSFKKGKHQEVYDNFTRNPMKLKLQHIGFWFGRLSSCCTVIFKILSWTLSALLFLLLEHVTTQVRCGVWVIGWMMNLLRAFRVFARGVGQSISSKGPVFGTTNWIKTSWNCSLVLTTHKSPKKCHKRTIHDHHPMFLNLYMLPTVQKSSTIWDT